MTKIKDVVGNSIEDSVEDFLQSFVFKEINEISKPYKDKYNKDDSYTGEFVTNFLNVLTMGFSLYVFNKLQSIFFTRLPKIFGFIWSYIIAGKMKKNLYNRLKNSKIKGNKAFKIISLISGTDRTAERIEISKIIQDNVKQYDVHKMHLENQYFKTQKHIDDVSLKSVGLKESLDKNSMNLLLHKTRTGTWKNTKQDKKLYEKATGMKISESGNMSWSNMYQELNNYTDFAKTVDDKIVNLATALNKILARTGAVS